MCGNRIRVASAVSLLVTAMWTAPALFAQEDCPAPVITGLSVTYLDYGGAQVDISHDHVRVLHTSFNGIDDHYDLSTYHPAPNPFRVTVNRSCILGALPFRVVAENCFPAKTAQSGTSISGGDKTPVIQLSPKALTNVTSPDSVAMTLNVKYRFPNVISLFSHHYFHWYQLPTKDSPGSFEGEHRFVEGEQNFGYTERARSSRVFVAWTCAGVTSQQAFTYGHPCEGGECEENDCSGCVGDPVNTMSGNMRYEELDPLPAAEFLPFERVYNSRSGSSGLFGRKWSSIFDAWLRTMDDATGTTWVTLGTETGREYIFSGAGGVYAQVQPPVEANRASLTRRADGSWSLIEASGRIERIFSADGVPVGYVDRFDGRRVTLSWSGGFPTRVDDSYGNWALLIGTDANARRIRSITVDGQPGLVWTYSYENGLLTRVDSPLGLWRTYQYEPQYWTIPVEEWPLSVIRDGSGALVESHNYIDNVYQARNSVGPSGDIDTILYKAPGRTEFETRTEVRYKSGRIEQHYRRFVAGQWRTVEIDDGGGCAACNSRGSVTAYDTHGNILRVQDSRGYVTRHVYDADGKHRMQTVTALLPVGCDPETAADRCRQTPEALVTVTLEPTSGTTVTAFAYSDARWPDKPTAIGRPSVVATGRMRWENISYHPVSGRIVSRGISGWRNGEEGPEPVERTTRTSFYGDAHLCDPDGDEGCEPDDGLSPVFAPGGAFQSQWLTLP